MMKKVSALSLALLLVMIAVPASASSVDDNLCVLAQSGVGGLGFDMVFDANDQLFMPADNLGSTVDMVHSIDASDHSDISYPSKYNFYLHTTQTTYASAVPELDGPRGLAVHNGEEYLFAAGRDADYVTAIDISNMAAPSVEATVSLPTDTQPWAMTVDETNDLLFITTDGTTSSDSVYIYDISSPDAPSGQEVYSLGIDDIRDVVVNGDIAYFAGFDSAEIGILDYTSGYDSASVETPVTHVDMSEIAGLYLDGTDLYVAGDEALFIYDVSGLNAAAPAYVGKVTNDIRLSNAKSILVNGNYAYVGGDSGTTIVDISDTASPEVERLIDLNGSYGLKHYALALSGNDLIVLASGGLGVSILDLSCIHASSSSTPVTSPVSSNRAALLVATLQRQARTQQTVRVAGAATSPLLKNGSQGPFVTAAQGLLAAEGHYAGSIDGMFGPVTEQAVKTYQAQNNLSTDGMVGVQTWSSLMQ